MKEDKKKHNKQVELEQQLGELTLDLQRTRADFENYRKRIDAEKSAARSFGKLDAVMELLPVIDTIDRAIAHVPKELKGNAWAEGIKSMSKNVETMLLKLNLSKISPVVGEPFDPELHEAVQLEPNDEATTDDEVVSELLRIGYKLGGDVVRPAMVKVTHK